MDNKGKWIKDRSTIKCSKCGFSMFPAGYYFKNDECISANDDSYRPKFCQECGCDMRGDKK